VSDAPNKLTRRSALALMGTASAVATATVTAAATEACLALFRADGSPSPRGAQKKELSCTNRANFLGGPSVFMGMLTLGEA
jgi:hypothetical protein